MRRQSALLSLLLLAACSEDPVGPPPAAPVGPPVDFAGTDDMPCSFEAPTYDETCPFGITRGAGGGVALRVESPAVQPQPAERVLLYQDGVWTTLDGSIAESAREGEVTFVAVDEVEFYAVPHDALTGDAVTGD